ncbi:choice-of-anchor L domain-containing protein, partial [Flavobacterium sp.]|uniref:choice-of-anchor L domain-containing protein n=1 Tax=Flavobacterium sp. TaxID=239 RepID=UPI002B4AF7D0
MKKITLSLLLTLCSFYGFSQAITTSTTNYTVPQLVTDVLFGSGVGGGACAGTISNITWTSCGNNGIGSFTNTNPNFPLQSGVVLVSGNVSATPGPNNTTQSNGNCGGDQELFDYIQALGIDPNLNSYNDASILEFDFVPLTNTMSFDFLFASEEYGTFQCDFSDAFAFFLTNTTAGTPTTNLALIPNTTIPVSVITIRNTLHNTACLSANPLFFDKFYQLPTGLNPNIAPINFNGHTVKMTASSNVVPNDTYHIKLVVADRNDSALDSAVFLGGGSFNIGQANISGAAGTGFEALTDFTIANGAALCFQSCREVRAGTAPIPGVTYQWTLEGVPIPAATNFNYNICAPGTYGIIITFPSGCIQEDSMEVEFLPAMPVANPVDLYSGSTLFDLTLNSPTILNGQSASDYILNYHLTLQDAIDVANIIPNPASFIGFDGQEIFVSIQDDASGTDCRETRSFILHIVEPGAVTPPDLVLCDDVSNDGTEIFNLVQQTPIILGSNIASDYIITYHTSQFDADNDLNPIANPVAYPNNPNPQIIYVRMEEVGNPTAFDSVFFQLIVNQYPIAGLDGAITVCETSTTAIDLFSLITGEQSGGVWTQNSGSGG